MSDAEKSLGGDAKSVLSDDEAEASEEDDDDDDGGFVFATRIVMKPAMGSWRV